jgi:hypothetical protein
MTRPKPALRLRAEMLKFSDGLCASVSTLACERPCNTQIRPL